jgi:cytoskeletal protein CcmA (bactofilin family)
MFEKQKGEVVVNEGAAETIVGTSVKLKGNLKSDGDVVIDGVVTGEVKTKGSVKIGPNANIIANVKAKNVAISGAVQGNVEAQDRLEISETGKVLGDIAANVLSIAPGAVFSGKSTMVEVHKEEITEPVAETGEESEETATEEK